MFWLFRNLFRRKLLILGLTVFLFVMMFLPTRVLFVQVDGNTQISPRRILEAAGECGIRFGASRREVRSEQMKNALLSAIPQLQWAGVNTYGCLAVISVREREIMPAEIPLPPVSSIVAARDSIVTSATVTRGNPLFSIGDAVQQGQILVSGYTDCGIQIQATRADAEIYGNTNHLLQVITPSEITRKVKKTKTHRRYSILIGKKRINLWKDSGISDTTCDRMYAQYYVTLPGGYKLPLAFVAETLHHWDTEVVPRSQQQAENAMILFSQVYLKNQMVAGSILQADYDFQIVENGYTLEANFICEELISRIQPEEIGEVYGKDYGADRQR